jgi:hypothetical protein
VAAGADVTADMAVAAGGIKPFATDFTD